VSTCEIQSTFAACKAQPSPGHTHTPNTLIPRGSQSKHHAHDHILKARKQAKWAGGHAPVPYRWPPPCLGTGAQRGPTTTTESKHSDPLLGFP